MTRSGVVALKTNEIDRFVARPDPARPVVLIFGADAGLVRERAEKIVRGSVDNADDPFSLVRLEGEDLSGDAGRLVDEANTIPLFGGRRAVWVRPGGRNIVPAVEALLASPPTECRVVIEAGDLRRGTALRNLCERSKIAVAIACYPDTERDIARLIDEEMQQASLSITPEARAALVPLLGGDRQGSRNEIRKLALYAQGKSHVDIDDVIAVVSEASEVKIDGILDAMFAGRIPDAESQYSRALSEGITANAIMFGALRQLSSLHKMRLSVEEGRSATQVLDAVQPPIHFRRKPLLEAALKSWTAERLTRVMQQLAEAALDVRRQPALAGAIAQRAVLSIASSARRKN